MPLASECMPRGRLVEQVCDLPWDQSLDTGALPVGFAYDNPRRRMFVQEGLALGTIT
jgi:hypothetical protein